jgi:hypothetical protein
MAASGFGIETQFFLKTPLPFLFEALFDSFFQAPFFGLLINPGLADVLDL